MKRTVLPSGILSKILVAASLGLLLNASLFAATYYIAPAGSDTAAGTLAAPFKTITKAQSVAASGDTVLIRGGNYSSFAIAGSDANYNYVHVLSKSGITYKAYTGEVPSFIFSNVGTSKRVCAFHVTGANITFEGFRVTAVKVGAQKQSECFRVLGNNNTFRRLITYNNEANGIYTTGNATGTLVDNCDSYNNIGIDAAVGNTDGFGSHAGTTTFTGCRAWNNSDDGFDLITSKGAVVVRYCWAYNHRLGGNKTGFKIGGYGTGTVPSSVPVHTVTHCLSALNGANGFYANHQPGKAADWTYNTAYNNGANFDMLERVSPSDATDISGTREVLHYNIAFTGTIIKNENVPAANKTDNSWTKSGVTVSSADFQSLDASQMTLARNSDGSLPAITFMKLVSGSDLAGMGF